MPDQYFLRNPDPDAFQRPCAAAFHAGYGEFEATIHIDTLEITQSELPGRRRCRENEPPLKIEPLA
jgi:hypothetical protein